jgi:hypothetical protein
MPYIDEERRIIMEHSLASLGAHIISNKSNRAGLLNYSISYLMGAIVNDELNYATLNELVGVLECAKLELYRRIVSPYEDTKMESNGDVY